MNANTESKSAPSAEQYLENYQQAHEAISDVLNEPTPFDRVKAQIQGDPDFAWGWHCNLVGSMSRKTFKEDDAMELAWRANLAAADFLFVAFHVDMQKNSIFVNWVKTFAENNPAVVQKFWAHRKAELAPYASAEYLEQERRFYLGDAPEAEAQEAISGRTRAIVTLADDDTNPQQTVAKVMQEVTSLRDNSVTVEKIHAMGKSFSHTDPFNLAQKPGN